jgi:hypothetical protein
VKKLLKLYLLVIFLGGLLTGSSQAYRDQETGTFLTRDPAGFVDGPNLYAYVNQNPWTKFDPEGLFPNDFSSSFVVEVAPLTGIGASRMDSSGAPPGDSAPGESEVLRAPDGTRHPIGTKIRSDIPGIEAIRNYEKTGNFQYIEQVKQITGNGSFSGFGFGMLVLGATDPAQYEKITTGINASVAQKYGGGANAPPANSNSSLPRKPASTPEPQDLAPENSAKIIWINKSKYPESAQHLEDAGAVGVPLTIDRTGAAARRKAALKGLPTLPGLDRDEAPPALFLEGSKSVRGIPPSDNRGSGSSMGNQARDVPDGGKAILKTYTPDE